MYYPRPYFLCRNMLNSLKKKFNFLQGGCLHHRMGLELEYIEEFEGIFETVSDCASRDKQKKTYSFYEYNKGGEFPDKVAE